MAVSALSPSRAWAVGQTFVGDGNGQAATLIESWDGASWRIASSSVAGGLSGVAAVSPYDVWAVGAQTVEMGGHLALIERWNGTRWSVMPSPEEVSAHFNSSLSSVVALAANDVWAVGSYGDPGRIWPLTERWDGAAWKVVVAPDPPGAWDSKLNAVARIPGTNQLWAVGSTLKTQPVNYSQALIERWNGSAWSMVSGPTLPAGSFGAALNGVVALSANEAWSVGEYTASDHTIRALIAHWDGVAWTIVSGPRAWGKLSAVAASARDVRAVGYQFTGSEGQIQRGLIEQWDGSTWRVVESPAPDDATSAHFIGVTAASAGAYWTVGDYLTAASSSQALIARCA